MIKHAFFDWNGTLIADTAPIVEGVKKELEVYGHPAITVRQYRENYDVPISDFLVKIGVKREVIEEKGLEAAKVFYAYYEPRVAKAHTRKGVRQALDALGRKDIRRAILSNHTLEGINLQLARLKLDHLFEAVLANGGQLDNVLYEGKEQKLLKYLTKNQIPELEVAIIGDTVEEVRISRNLGLKSVIIAGGHNSTKRLKEAKPDALIDRFDQLLDALEGL
jgi:phosphoglycolate phosphatase-like HAD superfamily hydrolase